MAALIAWLALLQLVSCPVSQRPAFSRVAGYLWSQQSPDGGGHSLPTALRAAGVPVSDPSFGCARVFIERCQNFDPEWPANADGGFFLSTTEFDTNKAGHDGMQFRSYGTTTSDGILALLAIGRPTEDERVVAARQWLARHHRDLQVPGFVGQAYQRCPRGLAFYYAAASALAFHQLIWNPWNEVPENLYKTQQANGSWANPE